MFISPSFADKKLHPAGNPTGRTHSDLSRLVSAAVINQGFCDLLLTQPVKALEQGFNGERFSLVQADKDLVLSIQAEDLADFASQLASGQKIVELTTESGWMPVNHPAAVFNAE